jgi:hypothetical protein
VPVEPFRERFIDLEGRGLITRYEIAQRLGWFRAASPGAKRGTLSGSRRRVPDSGRINRVLGLKRSEPQHTIRYELGVALCEILGLDPIDAGV